MIEYKLTQRDRIVALVIRGAIEMHKERRNAADKQRAQVAPIATHIRDIPISAAVQEETSRA